MTSDQPSPSQSRPDGYRSRRQSRSAFLGTLLVALLALLVLGCAGQPGTAGEAPTAASPAAVAVATEPPNPGQSGPPPTSRPNPTPGPTVPRVPALQPPAFASRVVVTGLRIDLPVISGDLQPPPSYPLCDVAAYVTRFNQPYEQGVTYISAHAQQGMFLPLLEASQRQDGQELLGGRVEVYTSDGRRFGYRIERVVRHAVDYAVVASIPLDQRYLVLQTSEGPYGSVEKLQVVASFADETATEPAEAMPEPRPRDCRPPDAAGSPAP